MRNAPDVVACVVGLGGNVGDVATTLRAAFDALDALPSTRLVRASGLYRTPAWGVTAQADFINAAALLETALPAHALLEVAPDAVIPGIGPAADALAAITSDDIRALG